MVGPQQTTGLIGQKWKTGNGFELTGTNRPTQTTTPPHTTHTACVGSPGGEQHSKRERPLYGPHPTQPPTTHHQRACVGVGRQPDNRITGTLTHCPCSRLGGHSDRETPGPIPNPEAKPDSADGTAPARVRESRTPPSTHHTAGPGTANNSGPGPTACLGVDEGPRHHPVLQVVTSRRLGSLMDLLLEGFDDAGNGFVGGLPVVGGECQQKGPPIPGKRRRYDCLHLLRGNASGC